MTIKNDLAQLRSKATTDAGFRARLLREPLAAAACLGIVLNATQVSAAQDLHQQVVNQVAAAAQPNDLPLILSLPGLVRVPTLMPRTG